MGGKNVWERSFDDLYLIVSIRLGEHKVFCFALRGMVERGECVGWGYTKGTLYTVITCDLFISRRMRA